MGDAIAAEIASPPTRAKMQPAKKQMPATKFLELTIAMDMVGANVMYPADPARYSGQCGILLPPISPKNFVISMT